MPKKLIFRYILSILFFTFSMPFTFSASVVFSQDVFKNAPGVIQIKVENNLLSVKLENAGLKEVLQEIARQTGLEFEGMENVEGQVTQSFENLPLDEGLKKISQSFIIILKKTGDKGAGLQIEKVIIIAHKGMAEEASSSGKKPMVTSSMVNQESPVEIKPPVTASATTSTPVSPPIPVPPWQRNEAAGPSIPIKPQNQATPPTPSVPPIPPIPPIPPKQPAKPLVVAKPQTVTQAPIIPKPVEKTPSVEEVPPVSPVSSPSPDVATKSLSSSSDSPDRKQAGKYFQEKRWDQAIKYFKRHLEKNPSDSEAKEMMETAKQNTDQAISLYREAKKLEEEQQFESAHEYYKKSYDIYPLLYDTWEKMRALKSKIKK